MKRDIEMESGMHDHDALLAAQQRKRVAVLLAMIVAIATLTAIEPVHRLTRSILAIAEPVIREHPIAGAIVFALLSALSAMIVLFSTAVITPIAVQAFGPVTAFFLLWLGWILGGITAFGIGRLFGRKVVGWFMDETRLRGYERRASRMVTFRHVLLFQLAVPSEVPGYVLGLAGCPFRRYVVAMALGELPFAIGAIYLGDTFLEGKYVLLLVIGIAGITLSWFAFHRAAKTW